MRYREMLRHGPTYVFLLALLVCCSGGRRGGESPAPSAQPPPSAQQPPPATAGSAARGPDVAVSAPSLHREAAELVRRLVARRPARMSELEAIVGPIQMSFRDEDDENMGDLRRPRSGTGEFTPLVPRLSIEYAFDVYHQLPTRPRDVGILTYTLEVRGAPGDAAEILRDALGAPRAVADGSRRYEAFHPFYLARSGSAPGLYRLAWYSRVPRFAIPEPDPAVRAAWLGALAHRIATAQSVDEIDVFCKAAPADAGIQITGTLNRIANPNGRPAADPRDYWIKFVPPVKALAVADAFGWGAIVGVSTDVHMASWYVERRGDGWRPLSGASAQWELRASFAEHPSGGPSPRGTRGNNSFNVREVAPEDELSALSIGPRFK